MASEGMGMPGKLVKVNGYPVVDLVVFDILEICM